MLASGFAIAFEIRAQLARKKQTRIKTKRLSGDEAL